MRAHEKLMSAKLKRAEPDAEVLELDAERHGGGGLQQEQHAAGDQQLVDGRRVEHRPDHQEVQQRAADTPPAGSPNTAASTNGTPPL